MPSWLVPAAIEEAMREEVAAQEAELALRCIAPPAKVEALVTSIHRLHMERCEDSRASPWPAPALPPLFAMAVNLVAGGMGTGAAMEEVRRRCKCDDLMKTIDLLRGWA